MQTSKGLNLIKGLDDQTQPNLQVLMVFTLLLLCYFTGQNVGQSQVIISCQRKIALEGSSSLFRVISVTDMSVSPEEPA